MAATAFIALTGSFGRSVRLPLPSARWQAKRRHRPSGPQVSNVDEFFGIAGLVAFWALAGRIGFRLRLSPPPRSEGLPVLLGLHRGHHDGQTTGDPETGERTSAKFS
jgi:hypothetical protein